MGFQNRFSGTFNKTMDLIMRGAIGEPKFFWGHHFSPLVLQDLEHWKFRGGSGGVVLEFGPHLLDLVLSMFGEPSSVFGRMKSMFSAGAEDYAHILLTYDSGPTGYVDLCWSMRNYTPGELMVEVHGKNGTLNVNEERIVLQVKDAVSGVLDAGTHFMHWTSLTPSVDFLLSGVLTTLEDDHFLRSVASNSQTRSDFDRASKVNKLIDAIKASDQGAL